MSIRFGCPFCQKIILGSAFEILREAFSFPESKERSAIFRIALDFMPQ